MKSFASVLLFAALAVSATQALRLQLKPKADVPIEYCNDATAGFLPSTTVNVDPYPVVIESGNTLNILATIELAQAIAVGSRLSIKLTKKGVIDIGIPCLQVGLPIPIGTCEYDGSEFLQLVTPCPEECPEGQANELPLNPGTYGGKGLSVTLPDIPAILLPFLKGTIEAIIKVTDASGAENICLKADVVFA